MWTSLDFTGLVRGEFIAIKTNENSLLQDTLTNSSNILPKYVQE